LLIKFISHRIGLRLRILTQMGFFVFSGMLVITDTDGRLHLGLFGGVMDAATGLIYVGSGQYYLPGRSSGHGDPATGRFLTREAKPENANPYVPWDAAGALLTRWSISGSAAIS
jgi:hypothetical protein